MPEGRHPPVPHAVPLAGGLNPLRRRLQSPDGPRPEERTTLDTDRIAARPTRSAGVLLHPTSLPGPYGIGDIGPAAHEWVAALASARQTWWQVLPLGPTGYGDSPYQSPSAFAGNPNLVSPDALAQEGLLDSSDLSPPRFPTDHVDYGSVIGFKTALLEKAWANFNAGRASHLRAAFDDYRQREASWLDEFGLFMALKDAHGGIAWHEWPDDLRLRKPAPLASAREAHRAAAGRHAFTQFLFARQWATLRRFANERGIRLIGDIPIFVSGDSAEVWSRPELFKLDADRRPTVVAGVPPDYFSATGQLWGNPHYDYAAMRKDGYAWWAARFKSVLAQVDLVRLDHFRGFAAAWEVPAGQPTAIKGEWVTGPGADLLACMRKELGGLPIIAEDLGVITPDVRKLREDFGLPGMRILQFAFSGPDNRFLPHHFEFNTVAYTGTHDNDTTVGWYAALAGDERKFLRKYLPWIGADIAGELTRMAWMSVADTAIVPLQDLLRLPTAARMNYPGKPSNNWRWRFAAGQVHAGVVTALGDLTALYSRERK
ncbi:MAG: 4-alpha-glucanotransferase [Gemmataceae bacterium]|nr:4-alpha-glucanotransferase [Gemmataceae bacterium]